ncbi:prepilin-type N-terminal cleavage/methylation domain-containing protein [Clostridium tunisiense]|uniref:prepilin-type N-terminal cleavage/methylation domain-containing protein n=1 Tax=Clostridium tunisiense TaxID=219748 RepID=UPI0002ECCAEA|nr:prepilin-type N-terminal cleavage/methylation domain-containing protein [Clostridium tunisiense]
MKKGFTLIELIITISLISIIVTASLMSLKGFKEFKDNFEMDYTVNHTIEFINSAKCFSRSKGSSSIIVINEEESDIQLYFNRRMLKNFKLPNNIKINSNNDDIEISNLGKIGSGEACTITLTNRRTNDAAQITLKVGTGYVSEKK